MMSNEQQLASWEGGIKKLQQQEWQQVDRRGRLGRLLLWCLLTQERLDEARRS
jgi:hypothetical protein